MIWVLKDAQEFRSHGSEGVGSDPGNQIAVPFAWSVENTEE